MTKEKEQKEKMKPLDMLLQMTGMIQYMANAMNIEAAGIIHNGGWCKELITSECPICKMEAEQNGNEDAKQ
tara:strand:- start:380 stop:592 length:213 start_codon:yes stop_codon:yes gene_type:complete